MDLCTNKTENIAEDEYLGTSLRKINDNFRVVQYNACELLTRMLTLSAMLKKLNIPEPFCNTKSVSANSNIAQHIDEDLCVWDSRPLINNNFKNFTDLSCSLSTSIDSLSTIVVKHPVGSTITVPAITNICNYVSGISPNEYIGDSYVKLVNNFSSLQGVYKHLIDLNDRLQSSICCPGPPTKRQALLDRFTLQGEGGYAGESFNFVNKDIMYCDLAFRNSYFTAALGPGWATTQYAYTTAFGGTTYYGLSGILRLSTGNVNTCAIFRDGNVYVAGSGPHYYPWIKEHLHEFVDLFMPSSYGTYFVQAVLLTSGDLFELDLDHRPAAPTLIMNNVEKIQCINQSHSSDFIVSTYSGEVWHIELNSLSWNSGPGWPSPMTLPQHRKSRIMKGPGSTIGLNSRDVEFMQLGDGNTGFVCLTADRTKVFNIIASGPRESGSGPASMLSHVNSVPYPVPLTPGELFVDGSSNECNYAFLTTKHLHTYRSNTYGGGFSYSKFSFLPGISAVRMATATGYRMSAQLTDGYYKIFNGECVSAYLQFEPMHEWNNLVAHLSGSRPDIFGFGTLDCCSCKSPPISGCGKALASEDDLTCLQTETMISTIEKE